MNKKAIRLSHILFLVICACCHLSSAAPDGGWDTLNKRKGAEAKICVTVVDPDGKPIGGVPVKGYFYLYTRGEVNKDIVLTDADGRADVKGMCSSYNAAIELQQGCTQHLGVNQSIPPWRLRFATDFEEENEWCPTPVSGTIHYKGVTHKSAASLIF